MELYYCIWVDSVSFDPWERAEDHAKTEPSPIHSCGFLITKTKEKVILALNVDPSHGNVSQTITIPMSVVKSLKKVKV